MTGLHLTTDLSDCAPTGAVCWSIEALRAHCLAAVSTSGLQAVGELFHTFSPAGSGVTGVVLLAESHLAVHTWPELNAATVDVYVCNFGQDNSSNAHALLRLLEVPFGAGQAERHQLKRGALPNKPAAA